MKMDRQRFSYVAHGDMQVWNPIQSLRFDDFASTLIVPQDGTVLDFGCGRAYWLIKIAESFSVKSAIGVDASPYAASAAKLRAANSRAGDRISIVEGKCDPTRVRQRIDRSYSLCWRIARIVELRDCASRIGTRCCDLAASC